MHVNFVSRMFMCLYIHAGGVNSPWVQAGIAAYPLPRYIVSTAAAEFFVIRDCCDHDPEQQVSALTLQTRTLLRILGRSHLPRL